MVDEDFQNCSCPRADKPLQCEECETLIAAGEVYHRIVGRWDGYDYTVDAHLDCHEARKRLNNEADLWGEEQMSIREHLEATPNDVPQLLSDDFPAVAERMLPDRTVVPAGQVQ